QGFGPQGNNDFKAKHGTTYLEKWGGHGSHLGDATLRQIVKNLKPGTYIVTAAVQNIQQGNNNAPETGAFLFAGSNRTEVGAAADYQATSVSYDGTLEIGVVLENCQGNWVCIDNFRLTLTEVTADLVPYMQNYINEANNIDQHNSSPERDELIAARDGLLYYKNNPSVNAGVSDAFQRLKDAIEAYKFSVASTTNPYNITSLIVNPSFEDGTKGWIANDMSAQTNDGYRNLKDGYTYMERWTDSGGVSDCSVQQIVQNLPAGEYQLTARAMNMTQSNENYNGNTGAYVFAENKEVDVHLVNDYSVSFTVVGKTATIGFRTQRATGNWVAVDNFRLYYNGFNETKVKSMMTSLINEAQNYVGNHMNAEVSNELNEALAQARAATTMEEMDEAAARLKPATTAAKESAQLYQNFATEIARVQTAANKVSGSNYKTEMQNTINEANAIYNNLAATAEQMDAAVKNLDDTLFKFRVSNGTGTAPTVTWNKEIIHGSRGACGRLEAKGSNIIERGFCWSTNPEPTVMDGHSSLNYSFNGIVYVMMLEPATVYYVRPYALTSTYAVGYGEPTKIITGFKSDIEYGFNWAAPSDLENEQCLEAMETAVQYLRDWTSIAGFRPYLNYESGKWGADCGYGGWISAGESYARNPGVLMHEMGHGIGVGQHWRYTSWDSPLHPTYLWTGDRANRVFAFFENQPDVYNADGTFASGGNHTVADGDRVHVCYGLSGVTAPIDLIRQAVFYQGMYEDGMPAVSDGACPFWSFKNEEGKKYYITNEKNEYGTKFLADENNKLSYKKISMADVQNDDAYAWYLTYVPTTGLYFLKNAKTGNYISYNGSAFVTNSTSNPSTNERIQLMPVRVKMETKLGNETIIRQTYWMVRGNRVENPEAMTVASSTTANITAPELNFYDNSEQQHWDFLTVEDMAAYDQANLALNSRRLEELINGSRNLLDSPHELINPEETNTDTDFLAIVKATDSSRASMTTSSQMSAAITSFTNDISDYLTKIQPVSISQPLDLTFLIDGADFPKGSMWDGLDENPTSPLQYNATSFALKQTVTNTPKGTYMFVLKGF
ncbi:MAG: hypothetical protein II806_03925, partial [Bacteroidaceae bacterium]|nr:hypothetical protein [Bacteroidaceae bacterium]